MMSRSKLMKVARSSRGDCDRLPIIQFSDDQDSALELALKLFGSSMRYCMDMSPLWKNRGACPRMGILSPGLPSLSSDVAPDRSEKLKAHYQYVHLSMPLIPKLFEPAAKAGTKEKVCNRGT
jgi:hypothetical protein